MKNKMIIVVVFLIFFMIGFLGVRGFLTQEKEKAFDLDGFHITLTDQFQEEEMDIEDRGGRPFVTISGRMICEKCQNETPYFADGSVSDENKEIYAVACGKGQKLFIKM